MDLLQPAISLSVVDRGASVECRGWLHKLSGRALRRSWKRRFFILKASILFYFKSESPDEPVHGMVNLCDYQSVELDPSCKKSAYALLILPAKGSALKPVHLFAQDAHELELWMASIQAKVVKFEVTGNTLDVALSRLGYQPTTASSVYSSSPASSVVSPLVTRRSTLRTKSSRESGSGLRGVRSVTTGSTSGVVSDNMSIESMTSGGTLSWDDRTAMASGNLRSNSADAGVPGTSTVPGFVQSPILHGQSSLHPFLSPTSTSASASSTWRTGAHSSVASRRLSASMQELNRSRSSPYLQQVPQRPHLRLTVPESSGFVGSDDDTTTTGSALDDAESQMPPPRARSSTIQVQSSVYPASPSSSLGTVPLALSSSGDTVLTRKSIKTPISEIAAEFGVVVPEDKALDSDTQPVVSKHIMSTAPLLSAARGHELSAVTPPATRSGNHNRPMHGQKLSLELMVQMVQEQLTLRSAASSSTESLPSTLRSA